MSYPDMRRMPPAWGPDTRKDWASGKQMHERPPGCGLMIGWAILVGWWLTLLGSVGGWLLVLSGAKTLSGLRLFGRLPVWGFPLLPGVKFLEDIDNTINALEDGERNQVHPALRVAYAVAIGWWLSALVVVLAWVLLMTLFAIPAAQQLHCKIPRLATLARY